MTVTILEDASVGALKSLNNSVSWSNPNIVQPTYTWGESRVGLRHVDAVVENVCGGGGWLGVGDALWEGGGVGWADVWRRGGRVGGRVGVGRLLWPSQLRHGGRVARARLLLLDAGRARGPAAGPHARVGGVRVVLRPRPLDVLLQVAVDVAIVIWMIKVG